MRDAALVGMRPQGSHSGCRPGFGDAEVRAAALVSWCKWAVRPNGLTVAGAAQEPRAVGISLINDSVNRWGPCSRRTECWRC